MNLSINIFVACFSMLSGFERDLKIQQVELLAVLPKEEIIRSFRKCVRRNNYL